MATVAVAAPERQAEQQEEEAIGNEKFVWAKHWYPIVPLEWLEEARGEGYESGLPQIQRQTILGRDIVVWKDAEGEWRAVEDRCSHRLAALSLGSVQKDGTLACRYHGWCFNGRGECTHIPQATDATSEATACASSRSKIVAFPTLEAHSFLWVWPDESPTSWVDAAMAKPAVGAVTEPDAVWSTDEYAVTFGALMENIFDPAHLFHLHNGMPSGFSKFQPPTFSPAAENPMMFAKQVGDMTPNGGFKISHGQYFKGDLRKDFTMQFTPPCLTCWRNVSPDGTIVNFEINYVPLRPGHTRFYAAFKRDTSNVTPPPSAEGALQLGDIAQKVVGALAAWPLMLKKLAFGIVPDFLRKSLQHHGLLVKMGNQDKVSLHSEDLALIGSNMPFQQKTYLPTPSDVGVAAFRKWMEMHGGGEPAWFGGGTEAEAVQKIRQDGMFDRWELHSRRCPTCRKSLKFLGAMEAVVSKAAAIFLGLAALLVCMRASDPRLAMTATVVAGAALLLRFEAQKLRSQFLSNIPDTGIPEVSFGWPS
ncbi:unnamed protein product [Ostreobium quekettii]|uniref:Rieske domain-containing protein n=1 Tax=Ostreobium quekettii TaxID=121088 RepID=A0A8S1J2R8_9CHLO|nr:unnamed protein product [Ostreobium quekettii]